MKDKLYHNPKLEVRKSSTHGYGVFAKEDIKKGELLEECHYRAVEGYFEDDDLQKHNFLLTFDLSYYTHHKNTLT